MSEAAGRLVLIDSFGLIYRAFFAMPPLTNSKGVHTNAVLGFVNMLTRIISEEKPTYLVAAFDNGRPEARIERFPAYKAQRERMPDELRSQIPLIRRVLDAFGVPIVEQENQEADDIIATLARKSEAAHEVRILTGDLDLLQLVDERTTVVVPKKGIGELTHYTPAAVRERYGLEPTQLPDYRGLKGDPSDNLTGVPGIGEKTAVKLIAAAGTLDALLADPRSAPTDKLHRLLVEHADMARLCRDLSCAITDLAVEVPWDAARFTPPAQAALAALYRELDFKQLLVRLGPIVEGEPRAGGISPEATIPETPPPGIPVIRGSYTAYGMPKTAIEQAALFNALQTLRNYPRLAFARRENELGIAWAEGEALSFDMASCGDASLRAAVFSVITEVPELVAHDAKALFAALRGGGIADEGKKRPASASAKRIAEASRQFGFFDAVEPSVDVQSVAEVPTLQPRAVADDTMVGVYVLQPPHPIPTLTDAVHYVLESSLPAEATAWADAVWRMSVAIREKLHERAQLALYEEIELPTLTILAEMERVGIAFDPEELSVIADEIALKITAIQRDVYALAGEEFNMGSPKQLGTILFEKLGIPGGKKNKTGYATGVEVLTRLADDFEIAQRMLEYREVTKLKNGYIDVLPSLVQADGRIHTTLNQTETSTGRISSLNPNLQQIPVRSDLGRQVRKAFVAGAPGKLFVAADYSQIELRLMAHLSGDASMQAAFIAGHDIHDETARRIFGLGVGAEVNAEQRRLAKSVNFGLLYGMGEFGLAQRLRIPRDEARALIDMYFSQFPGVRGYLDTTIAYGREHGYVQTIAGRRRYLPDLHSRDHALRAAAEREATNAPLQGGAADLVKIAMIRVVQALKPYQAQLLLQIHDELLFEVASDALPAIVGIVREEMAQAMSLSIPLEVTVKTGPTWYDVAAYDEQAVFEDLVGVA